MIRLIAADETAVLTERQIQRLQFWILEILPARKCEIRPGPGTQNIVPEHLGDRGRERVADARLSPVS
ncbi:hypothetical protein [Sphaerisporangium sp. NPDC051011]|uniref:hypothetical protein n=1 Tax=Sphaerisporangium sp. NPDC051011 TaxID=3155792 RepID=UPI0033CB48A2